MSRFNADEVLSKFIYDDEEAGSASEDENSDHCEENYSESEQSVIESNCDDYEDEEENLSSVYDLNQEKSLPHSKTTESMQSVAKNIPESFSAASMQSLVKNIAHSDSKMSIEAMSISNSNQNILTAIPTKSFFKEPPVPPSKKYPTNYTSTIFTQVKKKSSKVLNKSINSKATSKKALKHEILVNYFYLLKTLIRIFVHTLFMDKILKIRLNFIAIFGQKISFFCLRNTDKIKDILYMSNNFLKII